MNDRPELPGAWISRPGFDPSELRSVDAPPTDGTPVARVDDPNQPCMQMPPPFEPDPSLIKHVDVVRRPKRAHECELPKHGDHERGTIVRCRTCGKRYELKRVPPQRVGGGVKVGYTGWVRRYWPWPR